MSLNSLIFFLSFLSNQEPTDPEIIANLAALAPYTSKSNESNPSQVYVG